MVSPLGTLTYMLFYLCFILTGQLPGQGPEGHELQGADVIYYNDGHDLDGYGEWKYVVYQAEMDGDGNCRYSSVPVASEMNSADSNTIITMQSAVQTTTCLTEVIVGYPADGIDYNPITGIPFAWNRCATPESGYSCESEEQVAIESPATPAP